MFTGAHAYPAEKILDRRQLFFLANHNSPEQTLHTRLNLNEVEQDVDDDWDTVSVNSRAKRPQMNGEAYITETNVKGRKVTSGLPGWIFLYSAQFSFSWPRVDLARLPRRAYSRSVWIISFEFVKVCGIRFFIWESFIGFYICFYPISTILACLFSVEVRISGKTLCWKGAWRRKCHLVSPTLYIIIVYRVSLNKLSRNFVGALRTTTTNCRVSFIDLYLVFPRNFRMVFLPHTNTVILLEPYCGTITEPGLPVTKSI